jgi:hypothetical protein
MKSTIPQPTAAEWHHAAELYHLERAVRGVLDGAAPSISAPERTAVLTEALSAAVLYSGAWCSACQADFDGICKDHAAASELADASRRHAYRQLPGRPLIDVDL